MVTMMLHRTRSILLLVGSTGCHSANSYAVARSLPAGEFSGTVALEGFQIKRTSRAPSGEPFPERKSESHALVLPTLMLGYGASSGIEVRGSLRDLYSLGLDVKVQFSRGAVAMALMPGGQLNPRVAMGTLPLLIDLRPVDFLTFVLSPGIAAGASLEESSTAAQSDGVYAQLGFGVRLDVSRRLSLHPEVTVMRSLVDPSTQWLTVGLGLLGPGAP